MLDIPPKEIAKVGDNWETLTAIFAALHSEFGFSLDVAQNEHNRKIGPRIEDAFNYDWCWECQLHNPIEGWGAIFCNPPYSNPAPWLQKAAEEAEKGATCVLLVSVATDTKYWRDWALKADEIRFITGRLRFEYHGKPYQTARVGSAILVYRPTHLKGYRFGPAESYIHRDKLIEVGRKSLEINR